MVSLTVNADPAAAPSRTPGMEAFLMVTIILTTLALSIALGILAITGFVNLISRFLAKDATLTPPRPSP
jgi:hypothetical protein